MEVAIPAGGAMLGADLELPSGEEERSGCAGLVVFAHGSGSSRHSPRNRRVAAGLGERRFATLLLDLLEPGEERDRRNVFDIDLIADRLVAATSWAAAQPELSGLGIGYFGASTGAAAALAASVAYGPAVAAVVSRGGRTDLAAAYHGQVTAATLLVVGGADAVVLELNRQTLAALDAPADLLVVPGAGHLFAEPGALDAVTDAAGDWLDRYLDASPTADGAR